MTTKPEAGPMDLPVMPCPLCGDTPRVVDLCGWEILCTCGLSLCLVEPDKGPLVEHWNKRQGVEPCAWGMPDAEGNIIESISPDEKIGEMKGWAAQYNVPLYLSPNADAKDAARYQWLKSTGAVCSQVRSGEDPATFELADIGRPALGLDGAVEDAMQRPKMRAYLMGLAYWWMSCPLWGKWSPRPE